MRSNGNRVFVEQNYYENGKVFIRLTECEGFPKADGFPTDELTYYAEEIDDELSYWVAGNLETEDIDGMVEQLEETLKYRYWIEVTAYV
jgi:hypothetical protein